MSEVKAPHFPQQPVSRQMDDGSLELECFLEAKPTPGIRWFYENTELKADDVRFAFELQNKGGDTFSAILKIQEPVDADAGAYHCVTVNPYGKSTANFNLSLKGFNSPTFIEKPQILSADEGRVMILEFKIKSMLKPTFIWKHGDQELVESDRLNIVEKEISFYEYYAAFQITDPKKSMDAGEYVCTVENASGKLTATFTITFEVPQGAPSFTRKPQILQTVSSCGSPAVVFDIGFQADKNHAITWINPNSKKMKEGGRITFSQSSDGSANSFTAQLELKNYKVKDSGTYICNIKNDNGEANAEFVFNVQEDSVKKE
ncbi:hypothetical protein L596_013849 [Steinernema carpocapsae]|uniref:Ig-like domain-containing protein n=1 Tax=Steinernema carpocapsae TaxID=34508 RepID=A0A4U5P1I7_STECR|nr:hypothetical protein L596_013849 [Steinernema carpocapsae]